MQVEFWAIDRLKPNPRNARTHSPEQVAHLAGLIEEFGWTNPILADAAGIHAGHGRRLAALEIYGGGGLIRLPPVKPGQPGEAIPDGTVPVICCSGWSPAQVRAYMLADNRSAELAGWDLVALRTELLDLRTEGIGWDLIGWTDDDLAGLLAGNTSEESDDEEQPDDDYEPERGQPLAIVLQPEELRRWRRAKELLGLTLDRAALLRLTDRFLEGSNG